jgi:hypothetical protein
MNRMTSRTLAHRLAVPSSNRGALPRLAGGPVLALLMLSLAACGRGGDAAGDNVAKVESAAVTGVTPVLTISPGATNFTAQGAPIVVDPNLTLTISDGSDLDGVQVSISTGYVSGQDALNVTNQLGVSATWSAATGC